MSGISKDGVSEQIKGGFKHEPPFDVLRNLPDCLCPQAIACDHLSVS